MKCPVCGKEARARVYRCAKCAVLIHVACWPKHRAVAHAETRTEARTSPYVRRGKR